ncbi:hypothetical protein SAMN04490244_106106 [Tranquillimonas rosea]|uniref:DUF1513 domain-containing protein n=1 Tax=Tranquillimonas rosea TaxID=641238 RepID=A0A1H9UYR1_9RHOB|nr:DUF1513 domain-containing protein [Tranquillimonas rosea]SES14625.1 hypothetical protein SAMN04490244_106106 [Tranquillimonas rosea]
MTTRRAFLASLAAAAAIPGLSWADAGSPAYLAAARDEDGAFALYGLTAQGADLFRIPLPDRGHAAAAHPEAPEAVAFARRPGTFALVLDCALGKLAARLEAPEGRHFYGHGAFLLDGDTLCTTENDVATGEGRIGMWSRSDGYRRIGEVASGGVGPHEILLRPDGGLVVGNGGIRTHPDRGREKLNIDTMVPNLAYMSSDGMLEETVELREDLHKNSIRHIAVREDGLVAFAMQWQGDASAATPLLGLHQRGRPPVLASADLAEQIAMQGYAGSVAFDGDGRTVAITSPRGGRLHRFSDAGELVEVHRRADICGVATAAHGFVASDGMGGLFGLEAHEMHALGKRPRSWDNHIVRIGGLV